MAENYFEQFGVADPDGKTFAPENTQKEPSNFFSAFEDEPDAVKVTEPEPPVAVPQTEQLEEIPGMSWVDFVAEKMERDTTERERKEKETRDTQRGSGFFESLIDPQQYGEFFKGIIPGGIRFAGTTLKGSAGIQSASMQASKTDAERQLALFDRIDRGEIDVAEPGFEIEVSAYKNMTAEQRQDYRGRLQTAASPVTPVKERSLYKVGHAVTDYAQSLLPADPAYRQAVGRQLGEGIGSLLAGLPAAWTGPAGAFAFFGTGGAGEAVERAIQTDQQRRKAGKPGLTQEQITTAALWGIGPGATDMLPIEILMGRLRVPKPFQKVFARAIGRVGGQAFIEGLQEGGQSFLQNLIAQQVYDDTQALGHGVLPEAGIGAGVGGIAEVGRLLLARFAGRRGGAQPPPETEDAIDIRDIAEAIDNPQEVARETKEDRLDTVEAAQEAEQAAPDAAESPRFRRRMARPSEASAETVLSFLRERGGLQPVGELTALDAQRYPGLLSRQGLMPDEAREALVEAGFLAETGPQEAPETTPNDVYGLVDRALRGERIVRMQDQTVEQERLATEEAYELDRELEAAEENFVLPSIAEIDAELGMPVLAEAYRKLPNDNKAELIERVARAREDVGDLLEEFAVRGEDAPAIAAMAVARGLRREQIEPFRALIEQAAPEALQDFDQLLQSVSRAERAGAAGPERQQADLDQRRHFARILNSRVPSAQWARRLGISEDALTPLIDEAVEKNWLKRDSKGNLRRTAKSRRTGSVAAMAVPSDLPGPVPGEGDVSLTPAAQDNVDALQSAVDRAAAKILPDAVRVRVVERIEVLRQTREDAMLTMRNEAALRKAPYARPIDDYRGSEGSAETIARGQRGAQRFGVPYSPARGRAGIAKEVPFKVKGYEGEFKTVSKTKDGLIRRKYYLRDKAGRQLAEMHVEQRPGGVGFIYDVEAPGLGAQFYDAVENHLDVTLVPSGTLTEAGYKFWKKRNPDLVRWHQWSGEEGFYLSPREVATIREEMPGTPHIEALWNKLPEFVRKPEILDQMFAIRAFHGSPHEFDRFDLSRIGTGEGAQVFGHGLYFAESEGVARSYQASVPYQTLKRDFLSVLPDDAEFDEVMDLIGTGEFTDYQERVLRALEADDWLGFDYPSQAISAAYSNRLENWDPSPELVDAVASSGNLYEVEIDVEPEQLLDYDKPLSEQSEKIQEIVKDEIKRLQDRGDIMMPAYIKGVQDGTLSGRQVIELFGSDARGTQKWREAGIPGIRYFDQLSRAQSDGTRNVVIFDDSVVRITKVNGEPVTDAERQDVVDQQLAQQTQTPEFKSWFGDSKVVDENGDPRVVYHGASDVRGIFKEGFQAFSRGEVWFAASDYNVADSYADDRRALDYQNSEPQTIPLYLSITNPKIIDAKGKSWKGTEKQIKAAKDEGHDGVIIENVVDFYNNLEGSSKQTTTVYAFFAPTQAKSAVDGQLRSRVDGQLIPDAIGNRGTFDPADPRIAFALRGFYSPAIRAAEQLKQERGTGEQFLSMISKAPGVRQDELEWMGLEEFLKGKKAVTKADVITFMKAHQVELDEKILGEDGEAADIDRGLSIITAEEANNSAKYANAWSRDADKIWSFRVNDQQFYIASFEDDGRSTISVFDNEGTDVGEAPTLDAAQHMAVGIHLEDSEAGTRFQGYKVPGGDNYRELLIRLPELSEAAITPEEEAEIADIDRRLAEFDDIAAIQRASEGVETSEDDAMRQLHQRRQEIINKAFKPQYESTHFQDQEIVHLRVDDRIGPDGEKILFINEVQSDLHQRGRRQGYGKQNQSIILELQKRIQEINAEIENLELDPEYAYSETYGGETPMNMAEGRLAEAQTELVEAGQEKAIPNAPFKGDLWLELALKRALLYAAENGYDAVSWARSDQIAEAVGGDAKALSVQYDQKIGRFLSKYTKKWGGKVEVYRFDEFDDQSFGARIKQAIQLAEDSRLGQDAAVDEAVDDIVSDLRKAEERLGRGTTPDTIYNAMHPWTQDLFAETWGENRGNQILRVTPEMRSSVMEGQPLAMRRRPLSTQPEALGQTDPYNMAISIAMRAVEAEAASKGVAPEKEAVRVLRHEAVEFFKATGLFTNKEWDTLTKAAREQGWVETTGVRQAYESVYKGGMSEAELEDLLVKEAIAEQYSEFHLGRKTFSGKIAEIFQRLKDFLSRIANFARGEGFQTWDDVFERIDQGEFRSRFEAAFPELAPEPATGTRAIQATAGKLPGSPERQARPGTEQPSQSLADIIGRFNQTLGITVRQGRLDPTLVREARERGQDVRGQTSMQTGVVRLRVPNEIDTLAHEGGHGLENRFGSALDALKGQHAGELIPLASPGPDALSEGFAEWFRRYVTNPEAARRATPRFYAAFEQFLTTNNSEMLVSLQAIQKGYQEWIEAPSGGVVASAVATTIPPGSTKEVVREFKDLGLRNTMQMWVDRIYTTVFDDLHPVKMTVNGLLDIAAINLKIPRKKLGLKTTNNPYKLLRLARDGYAAGHMDLLHGVHDYQNIQPQGPSLRQAMATALGGYDKSQWSDEAAKEFGAYLISRRMIQEWQRFQQGELSHPPDKFSLADHQQSVKDFEAKYPGFAQGAQEVYAFLDNMLRKKRDAGLISLELYDGLIAKMDYVPVMRDRSDRGRGVEGAKSARKDKFSVIGRFRGSQRDIINPLESIAKDAYETAMIIARNDAIKALDALARAAGPDGGKFAERIPAQEMKATQVDVQEVLRIAAKDAGVDPADMQIMLQAVDDQLGDNAVAQIWRAGEISEKGEAIVYLWENGDRVPIRLADSSFGHDVLHAVAGLNREASHWMVNLLALPSTILRTGVTASLDFIGANYIRDQVSAWILTRDFVPFYDGAKGIYNDLTMKDVSRIYSRVGGIMGGANVAAQHESRIKREVQSLRRKGIRFTLNPFTRDFWRMTEFSETGTRLAVFQRAFDRAKNDGLSDWESSVEAAFIARDYIDFGRRGSRMLAVRRLVPFFNAALQGLDRGMRGILGRVDSERALRDAISPYIKSRTGQPLSAVERQNLRQSAQVWAYTATLGLVGLALSLLYRDDEEYEEISDYMKATHWLIRVNGEWVRIPKPFELAFVSNLMERTFDYTYKDDPTGYDRFWSGLYEITVPPHSIPGLAVTTELATDYNFFTGRPIVGPFLKRLPPELQFNAYASEFGKYLGKQVGVSPAYIDHFITGFGASWGREFVNASDQFLPTIGRLSDGAFGLPTQPSADPAVQDYFFIRRFTTDPRRGSNSIREFWDLMALQNGHFEQAASGYKHLVDKVRDVKGAQEFLEQLTDEERAYALLQAGNSNRRSKYRRLHPLERAKEIMTVAGGMKKEINLSRLYKGKDGEAIVLAPSEMRTVTDLLSDITMREARNSLIALKRRGWEQKKVLDVKPVYAELEAVAPDVHKELTDRLKKKKLPSYETIVKTWPVARDRILEDGQAAILIDLYQRDYSVGQGPAAGPQ